MKNLIDVPKEIVNKEEEKKETSDENSHIFSDDSENGNDQNDYFVELPKFNEIKESAVLIDVNSESVKTLISEE